ncbi:MAG: PTS sugar transporter subunit IIB [bacterium]|nr:PTS sugar transporter subunit IIB [bacterium]
MIEMMRVDDRLIHGQVAVMWSKELRVDRIIVASDTIAADSIQVSALKMAAPAGVKAAILPLEKVIGIINDPRSKNLRILVISNTPADLLEVAKGISEKPVLNIANYGRIGGGGLSTKKKVSESVYVTKEDERVVAEIHDLGIEVIHQPLPSDSRIDFIKLMGGKVRC